MDEGQAVAHMQDVLMEIRAELSGNPTDTQAATGGGEEDGGGAKQGHAGADAASKQVGDGDGVMDASRTVTRLSDLASLAGALDMPPVVTLQEAIAAERKASAQAADQKVKEAKAAEDEDKDGNKDKDSAARREEEEVHIPGSVNSTLSALDRLTTAVSEKLDRENHGK